jgi:hypothetical protein
VRHPGLRALCFNLVAVFVLLAGLEMWAFGAVRRGLAEAKQIHGDSIYSSVSDREFGYSLTPSETRTATKWFGEELVYQTQHTHNASGFRISPPRTAGRAETLPAVLFYGGSFTYGEGVNDKETMAYVTGDLLGNSFATYNFGVNGYGPQQMLASAEEGFAKAVVRDQPRYVIYQAIGDHVPRAAGRAPWLKRGPQYEVQSEGLRRVKGPVGARDDSRLRLLLETSNTARVIRARDWFVPRADLEVYLAILDRSRTVFEATYPAAEFHILLWNVDGNPLTAAMQRGFEEREMRVHLVSDVLPDYRNIHSPGSPYRVSRHDPHPHAEAQRRLARFIVTHIIRDDAP